MQAIDIRQLKVNAFCDGGSAHTYCSVTLSLLIPFGFINKLQIDKTSYQKPKMILDALHAL